MSSSMAPYQAGLVAKACEGVSRRRGVRGSIERKAASSLAEFVVRLIGESWPDIGEACAVRNEALGHHPRS